MNSGELTLTAGGLTSLVVEGIKWLVRRKMGADYNLPVLFYVLFIPVSNALMPFAIFALGFATSDPVLFMTWQNVVLYVVRVAIASLISFVSYSAGIKPLKDYHTTLKQLP